MVYRKFDRALCIFLRAFELSPDFSEAQSRDSHRLPAKVLS